jgi:RND family efflux transporter MFP subunit
MNITKKDFYTKLFMKKPLILVVICITAIVVIGLYSLKPKAKKARPKRPVPLVQTMEIVPRSERVHIEAYGSVIPARELVLQAEVEGRVISQHPELVPGGIIEKGDMIARIDPADYEFQLEEAKADLAEAQYELDLELGKQVIARHEWDLLEKDLDPRLLSGKKLALREPHLIQARAKLEAAGSRLEAAELALKRTKIIAPFSGIVLAEAVEPGQLVTRQTNLATLAGIETFWVQVAVPVENLDRLHFVSNHDGAGSSARIFLDLEGKPPVVRNGVVYKLLGDLDPQGRMARLLVTINDPLALTDEKAGNASGAAGKILIGSYVRVVMDAGMLDEVYVLPREAMRSGDRIWLVNKEGRLSVRPAQVVWRRTDDMLVRAEIKQEERLVVSRLQAPLPGMKVELAYSSGSAGPVKEKKK